MYSRVEVLVLTMTELFSIHALLSESGPVASGVLIWALDGASGEYNETICHFFLSFDREKVYS